ncbi:hypothetical protein Lalb_Chr24g0401441 [Lupinus albus]|uniref:Uncharacterized protein n=1 Tax=Lupinus albus TaxID=3870 RepID=A0A6A4MS56_LUPAL|nr:hypothetical protein Lalb_Chr24g0401441 [Lupinus albus]
MRTIPPATSWWRVRFSFLLNHFRCRCLIGCQVILKHSTLVHRGRKINNFLVPKHALQLGHQTRFKLRALGPPVHLKFGVGTKPGKFFKLGRIIPNRHVSLLQLQKFHFLLPLQVSRKVLKKEFLLECNPGDQLPFRFPLAPSKFPPVFGLLHQHISGICQLLSLRTAHGSEDPLHSLDPLNCSIRSKSPVELTGVPPAKFI